jgi:hypothetical protein
MTGTLQTPCFAGDHPVLSLPPQRRIANAAAVLEGPHGDVTRRAHEQGLSRQALYRDADRLLRTLQAQDPHPDLQALRDQVADLRRRLTELQARHRAAVVLDADRLAAFASTAQAEGVSLPVARRLLAPLLAQPLEGGPAARPRLPSVAQLGRWSQAAARRATALLPVLDEFSRRRVEQAAPDEIFFGKKPCLMVVEQQSLCWVSGRLADRRDGAEWAQEFRQLPALRQATQDGGTGLAKGLALVNRERQQAGQAAIVAQDDHFHVLREGARALRQMQGGVTRLLERAERADRQAAAKARQTGDGRGRGAAARAWQRAERALDAWSAAEKTWSEVGMALRLFTPEGALNTRARAEAAVRAALPRLPGPGWAKVRRALQRPELLTFLDKAQEGLSALALDGELLAAAVRVEGLRQQPQAVRGEGARASALRGVLLAAGMVLCLSGAAGSKAAASVRGVLRGVWRASSLVECLNSVARMQQGRHRKMTQGLLDLKRLYWNCRAFRTGHRRKKSPYELQGLCLPTREWWELLRLTPDQLRQQLRAANDVPPQPPPQKVSAQDVAA